MAGIVAARLVGTKKRKALFAPPSLPPPFLVRSFILSCGKREEHINSLSLFSLFLLPAFLSLVSPFPPLPWLSEKKGSGALFSRVRCCCPTKFSGFSRPHVEGGHDDDGAAATGWRPLCFFSFSSARFRGRRCPSISGHRPTDRSPTIFFGTPSFPPALLARRGSAREARRFFSFLTRAALPASPLFRRHRRRRRRPPPSLLNVDIDVAGVGRAGEGGARADGSALSPFLAHSLCANDDERCMGPSPPFPSVRAGR